MDVEAEPVESREKAGIKAKKRKTLSRSSATLRTDGREEDVKTAETDPADEQECRRILECLL